MHEYKKTKRGFVAIISVVFLASIMFATAITLSIHSMDERSNIFSIEMKERSMANSEACAEEAILHIANNNMLYSTTSLRINHTDSCIISPFNILGESIIFYTQSNTNNYFTNYKISIDSATLTTNYREEIENLD